MIIINTTLYFILTYFYLHDLKMKLKLTQLLRLTYIYSVL